MPCEPADVDVDVRTDFLPFFFHSYTWTSVIKPNKIKNQLYVSPKGELEKIDEFCMMYSERPNLSKSEWQVDGEVPSTGPVALREVGGGGGGGGGGGSSRNRY